MCLKAPPSTFDPCSCQVNGDGVSPMVSREVLPDFAVDPQLMWPRRPSWASRWPMRRPTAPRSPQSTRWPCCWPCPGSWRSGTSRCEEAFERLAVFRFDGSRRQRWGSSGWGESGAGSPNLPGLSALRCWGMTWWMSQRTASTRWICLRCWPNGDVPGDRGVDHRRLDRLDREPRGSWAASGAPGDLMSASTQRL